MRFLVVLLASALALASCSPTEPFTGVEISTNKVEYQVDEGFNLRIVNHSERSAWLSTSCDGRLRYDIEHRVRWFWELWVPVNECPLSIAQARPLHPSREAWESGFWTIPPGRYRIRLTVGLDQAHIESIYVYSPEFVVH